MVDYSSNVIFSSISYRRNIKDMPFVKSLTDMELAIGVARSASEIYGDEFEFKSLKNIPLETCLTLKEENVISDELIENKDISAFGINENKTKFIYINEQDHIRLMAKQNGFALEQCFNDANDLDDRLLEKLEVCFDLTHGYLTSNPKLFGTGMEICVGLFIPSIVKSGKIEKIKRELLKEEYDIFSYDMENWDQKTPFIVLKNRYTFGYKENEIASNMQSIVKKICELEALEENNQFDISSSGLVDEIYRDVGTLWGCYRLGLQEAKQKLASLIWGVKLNILKIKRDADVYALISSIKENHIGTNLSIKEQEKARAKLVNSFIINKVTKGEVDV